MKILVSNSQIQIWYESLLQKNLVVHILISDLNLILKPLWHESHFKTLP